MDTQLNAQELEKVLSCISIEIMKIDLNRDSSKPSLRQMILYSARDKLLKQQKTVKGEEVRSKMLEVMVGKVKWFDTVKGYGFLAYSENGHGEEKQVFVHYSAIEADGFKNLEAGQDVEFCIIEDTRGKHAINVRVI